MMRCERRSRRKGRAALLRLLGAAAASACAPQSKPVSPPVSPAPPAQATHQAVAPGEVTTSLQPAVPRIAIRSSDHMVGIALTGGAQHGKLSASGDSTQTTIA